MKSIVELQGGTVSVGPRSRPRSTFAFTLPVAERLSRSHLNRSIVPPINLPPEGTVLVVEGEPDIREQLNRIQSSAASAGQASIRRSCRAGHRHRRSSSDPLDQQRPESWSSPPSCPANSPPLRAPPVWIRGGRTRRPNPRTQDGSARHSVACSGTSIQRDASDQVRLSPPRPRPTHPPDGEPRRRSARRSAGARRGLTSISTTISTPASCYPLGCRRVDGPSNLWRQSTASLGIAAAFAQSPDLAPPDCAPARHPRLWCSPQLGVVHRLPRRFR